VKTNCTAVCQRWLKRAGAGRWHRFPPWGPWYSNTGPLFCVFYRRQRERERERGCVQKWINPQLCLRLHGRLSTWRAPGGVPYGSIIDRQVPLYWDPQRFNNRSKHRRLSGWPDSHVSRPDSHCTYWPSLIRHTHTHTHTNQAPGMIFKSLLMNVIQRNCAQSSYEIQRKTLIPNSKVIQKRRALIFYGPTV